MDLRHRPTAGIRRPRHRREGVSLRGGSYRLPRYLAACYHWYFETLSGGCDPCVCEVGVKNMIDPFKEIPGPTRRLAVVGIVASVVTTGMIYSRAERIAVEDNGRSSKKLAFQQPKDRKRAQGWFIPTTRIAEIATGNGLEIATALPLHPGRARQASTTNRCRTGRCRGRELRPRSATLCSKRGHARTLLSPRTRTPGFPAAPRVASAQSIRFAGLEQEIPLLLAIVGHLKRRNLMV